MQAGDAPSTSTSTAVSLKQKCRHFDEIFITGCIGSFHFDNFQCSQWWIFHQNEDFSVSVLVAWSCYQLMAKPGSRTAAVPWPDPYVFTVYMTHRLSVYIIYGHTNGALILVTSYLHIHFSYVHECILTALYCAVFVLLMHVFLSLSLLLLLYIVRNDENKDDQSIIYIWVTNNCIAY